MAAVGEIAPTSTVPLELAGDDRHRRFAVWAIACTGLTTLAVVVVTLIKTHGHIVYAIDDGGIHLSLARNLGLHGTWGVVPHHFQSASSSPLWTVLLAFCARVLPRSAFEYSPLLLSALAAAWLLVLLAYEQTILGTRRAALEIAAVGTLSIAVLFLPGLEMTGMEHVLHAALVVQALALFTASARAGRAPRWTAYGVLALASFARYETLFVAAGLAVAQLVLVFLRQDEPVRPRDLLVRLRRGVMIGAAAGMPVVIIGLISIAFGQQFFPNSVIAKSALGGGTNAKTINFFDGLAAIGTDPIVLTLFLAAVFYLAAAWTRRVHRSVVPATVAVVTVILHSFLADYGWFERYQAYLIALGCFFVLGAVSEVADPRHARVVAVVVLALAFALAPTKYRLLWNTPTASDNTYVQRYQAGLFLEHFYDGQPVATGELGYISYFHRGPITDLFGLGDHEVLVAREHHRKNAAYWEQLIRERGVKIVVVYPRTLLLDTPASWTLVGLWRLDLPNVTAFDDTLQFWAPDKSMVVPILHQLEAWNGRLPSGTDTEVNPLYTSPLPPFPCC